jgi:four helix bundle protein
MSARIESYRELVIYQRAFELQQELFRLSKSFPAEERYALTDQIRRSSRSVGANIAEAWQKRRYQAHFVSKLTDADGELAETEHWLDTSLACEYLDRETHRELLTKSRAVGRMLGKMIGTPQQWCHSHSLR